MAAALVERRSQRTPNTGDAATVATFMSGLLSTSMPNTAAPLTFAADVERRLAGVPTMQKGAGILELDAGIGNGQA